LISKGIGENGCIQRNENLPAKNGMRRQAWTFLGETRGKLGTVHSNTSREIMVGERALQEHVSNRAATTTNYSGNVATVTDPAGRSRKALTDALGRTTSVYEDPTGLNYLTTYTYDALDNLTGVTQGSQTQTRNFVCDSLKRLNTSDEPGERDNQSHRPI
jgi:YD repeat-containing protein